MRQTEILEYGLPPVAARRLPFLCTGAGAGLGVLVYPLFFAALIAGFREQEVLPFLAPVSYSLSKAGVPVGVYVGPFGPFLEWLACGICCDVIRRIRWLVRRWHKAAA